VQTGFDVVDNSHQNEHACDDGSYYHPDADLPCDWQPGGGANPAESAAKWGALVQRAASAFRLAFPRLTWSQISFPSQCAGNPHISLPIRQFASENAVFKHASRGKPAAWAVDFLLAKRVSVSPREFRQLCRRIVLRVETPVSIDIHVLVTIRHGDAGLTNHDGECGRPAC
jgi:hypothetical protein